VPDPDGYVDVENIKADRFYQGLKYAYDGGVARGVIDSIATRWASPLWPEANKSNYQSNNLPYSWENVAPKRTEDDSTEASGQPADSTKRTLTPTGPMPVREWTQLAFSVEQSGPTRIVLYNLLGQQVRVLYEGTPRSGRPYSVDVVVDNLASGTYFARLYAPTGTATQQIVVVR
jgi:hypothetical protein